MQNYYNELVKKLEIYIEREKTMPTKKKAPAKKKTTTKRSPAKIELPVSLAKAMPPKAMDRRLLSKLLIIIALGLLSYKFGPWLFPATINNKPISRFTLIKRLEQTYGEQTLDDLVNEKILNQAIANNGVTVSQAAVDRQVAIAEEQFAQLGGLDEALKQRGMSRNDLIKQITTQLSIEEILKDEIEPTEAEIAEEFETNADTFYADTTLEESSPMIMDNLRQQNLRNAFLEWFEEVKEEFQVKKFGL